MVVRRRFANSFQGRILVWRFFCSLAAKCSPCNPNAAPTTVFFAKRCCNRDCPGLDLERQVEGCRRAARWVYIIERPASAFTATLIEEPAGTKTPNCFRKPRPECPARFILHVWRAHDSFPSGRQPPPGAACFLRPRSRADRLSPSLSASPHSLCSSLVLSLSSHTVTTTTATRSRDSNRW